MRSNWIDSDFNKNNSIVGVKWNFLTHVVDLDSKEPSLASGRLILFDKSIKLKENNLKMMKMFEWT